jgi:hypothetical protein
MPRVTVVKRAQQRYATKPVLNEDGSQKTVVVTKNGAPRVKKSGAETLRRITERDLTKPLPMPRCDFPDCKHESRDIAVGESYKFITTRPGGRGKRHHYRHADHPSWQYWEYSSSVRAQAARLQHDMHNEIDAFEFGEADDFDALKESLHGQAESFFQEREDAVGNMPEHLQDESEAAQYRDAAETWAEEIEGVDTPDGAEDEVDCDECSGTGKVDEDCTACDAGQVECDECSGTGYEDEESGEACAECNADGTVDCTSCAGEGTIEEDCSECDGSGTVEGALDDDWVEATRDALREAVDSLEI